MSPDAARNAGQPKKPKEEAVTEAEVHSAVNSVKCIRLFALLAEKKLPFLFSLLATNRYFAGTAISPAPGIVGNMSENLPQGQVLLIAKKV